MVGGYTQQTCHLNWGIFFHIDNSKLGAASDSQTYQLHLAPRESDSSRSFFLGLELLYQLISY